MLKRTITAIVLYGFLLPILLIEPLKFIAFFVLSLFSLIGSFELLRAQTKDDNIGYGAKTINYIANAILSISIIASIRYAQIAWALIGIVVAIILVLSLLVFDKKIDAKTIGKIMVSVFLPSLGFGAISYIRSEGIEFLIYLLLVTTLTDVFAYFYGMLFGKHKLAPLVSPKKTWEGSLGGSIIAVLVASLFAINYGMLLFGETKMIFASFESFAKLNNGWSIAVIILISCFASFISQVGDLLYSKIKRTYDIKDFSNILPGHGGIMDRFDSVTYTAMFLSVILILLRII